MAFGLIWLLSGIPISATLGIPSVPNILLAGLLTVGFMSLGYYIPVKGLFDIHRMSRRKSKLTPKMKAIKRRLNYPIWQASGVIGILGLSIFFFIIKVIA